jgi:hypothetical protein
MRTGDGSDRDIVAAVANRRLWLFFNAILTQTAAIIGFFFCKSFSVVTFHEAADWLTWASSRTSATDLAKPS